MLTTKQENQLLKIITDNSVFDVTQGIKPSPVVIAEIFEYLQRNTNPDEVYSDKDLCAWAESNGYTKE